MPSLPCTCLRLATPSLHGNTSVAAIALGSVEVLHMYTLLPTHVSLSCETCACKPPALLPVGVAGLSSVGQDTSGPSMQMMSIVLVCSTTGHTHIPHAAVFVCVERTWGVPESYSICTRVCVEWHASANCKTRSGGTTRLSPPHTRAAASNRSGQGMAAVSNNSRNSRRS